MQVYAIEYHLAPEFKYPYQLKEVEAVLTWLAKNGKARGVDPSRICIGECCSAYVTLCLGGTLKQLHEAAAHVYHTSNLHVHLMFATTCHCSTMQSSSMDIFIYTQKC